MLRVSLFIACSLLASASSTPALAQSRAVEAKPVIVAPLVREPLQRRIETVGTASAIRSVTLFPAVADQVTALNVTPGQQIEEGKVLMQLDDRRQQTAYRRAQIQLADAERNVMRLKESQRKGAVAVSELDLAELTLALAKVDLEEARADLADRQLRAPFNGVLGITDIEVGERVTEQTVVATLDDISALLIDFVIPENAIASVAAGQNVTVIPWDTPETTYLANITQLDARINVADRSLRARALLPNNDQTIRPGASFKVLIESRGEELVAIPQAALLWGASGAYVWCVNDNKAVRREVNVRQRLRDKVLVEGEFAAQDAIIVEGVQRLRPGQAVATLPQQSASL